MISINNTLQYPRQYLQLQHRENYQSSRCRMCRLFRFRGTASASQMRGAYCKPEGSLKNLFYFSVYFAPLYRTHLRTTLVKVTGGVSPVVHSICAVLPSSSYSKHSPVEWLFTAGDPVQEALSYDNDNTVPPTLSRDTERQK